MALNNEMKSYFENARIAYDFWLRLTEYAMTLSVSEISKVDHAKAYIDQHYYMEDLNLDLVADRAGMSKYSLCKEFHKKYAKEYEFLVKNARKNNHHGLEPAEIGRIVLKAMTVKNPKLSYCAGFDAKMTELFSKLPLSLINFCTKASMKNRLR